MARTLTVLTVLVCLFNNAYADETPVEGNDVWTENIEDAADLMRVWFDDAATAATIQQALADEILYCDPDLDGNGETFSRYSRWIVLHQSMCEKPGGKVIVCGPAFLSDNERDFMRLFRLARTLRHESVHLAQHRQVLADDALKEQLAWEETILATIGWIDAYEANWARLRLDDVCAQARHVDRVIGMLQATISYISTYLGKPYTQNTGTWSALRTRLGVRLNAMGFRLTQLYLQGANLCPESDGYEQFCSDYFAGLIVPKVAQPKLTPRVRTVQPR